MEEPPPGAFHRDVADGDQRVLDELESLRKENLLYAEKLSKVNSENVALWDQIAALKRILLENRIPFAPRLTNGASRPFQNSSRRNSTDGGRLSDSYASRRESSSSRESRLSVSSGGADRADESPPQNAGAKDPGPLPPIRKGPNKEFTFPTGDLTPIGELTPSGSPLPGGVPKDSPLGGGAKSRLPRPQEGGHSSAASTPNGHPQTDSPGSSSDAAGRGGTSSWKGFQIRGSAKIHPLGGDEEVAASTREGRGVEPHASPAGGGSKLLSLGRGTKSKLNFKELWRKAAHMAVQNKRMGKNAVKWTIVIDQVQAKQHHWTAPFLRPLSAEGRFRKSWDLLLMFSLIYIVIVVPYTVAFNIASDRAHQPALYAINWTLDVIFFFDILVNFRSTYTSGRGKVVRDQKKIAMHYLKTWFVLDAISVMPLAFMVPANSANHNLQRLPVLLKIFRLNKLIKLVRVLRLSSTFEALENHVPHGLLTIIKFFLLMVVIGHLTACLFYFMAVVDNLNPRSWPAKEGVLHDSDLSKYVISLYWAFSTLCTVGYGDVVPNTTLERIFTIFAMLVGATVFAYFMGNMSVLVANLDQEAARQERQMESVNSFLRSRHIPKDLQTRVRDYYRYLWRHQVHSEENMIITGLNASLRTDVVLYMYRDMLEKVPFFHGKPPQFISSLVLCLRPEYFAPGDFIMREHDIGKDMYFIVEGHVHVLSARVGTFVKKPGEYFGEMALITGMRRSASCTAQTYCELYSLSKENLEHVLQDWPEIARDFYSQGLTRMQEAGLTPKATTPALQAAAVEDSPLAAAPARRRATVDVAAGFGADESSFRGLVVRPYGPTGGSERSLVEGGDLHTRHRGRRDGRSATV